MMKKSNTKRLRNSVIATLIALMLCIFATIGVTYALFTDRVDTENVINAGTLKITATHTTLTGYETDVRGQLVEITNTQKNTVLSNDNNPDESIFTIANAQPTLWQTATIKVENNDTVAFKYSVRIVNLTTTDNNPILPSSADEELSKQLTITMEGVDNNQVVTHTFKLSEYLNAGNVVNFGELTSGDEALFTVTVSFDNVVDAGDEFEQGATNNKAQNGGVKFDIQITAVQSTVATTNP